MKILVTGSSGFIGSALVQYLEEEGHEVIRMSRDRKHIDRDKKPRDNPFYWQPREKIIEFDEDTPLDAVINLAGENILGRWTSAKKEEILQSRVCGTTVLCETLAQAKHKPKVIINGSAMGYYGDQQAAIVDENTSAGTGFLAEVAINWENAAKPAIDAGIRTVFLRTGLVIGRQGGVLKNMLLPFQLGLGGKLGSGEQYMSWIAMADVLSIVTFLLEHPTIAGPVNMVAPSPVSNSEFTQTLGRVLKRPTLLPMPAFIARMVFGELADEALLSSTRVYPSALEQAGYQFKFKDLESCLAECLSR